MKRLALIALALAATTSAASAYDSRQDRINDRQYDQAYRIYQARRSGDLTLLEKWRLQAEQRRIADMERYALRDGRISRGEAHWIRDAQDRASRHIYNESHDGQVSWWRRRFWD